MEGTVKTARPTYLLLALTFAQAPAVAQDDPGLLLKKLNNLHAEMCTCVAYYKIVQKCLGDDPKHRATVAGYGVASNRLLEMSFALADTIGLTNDAAQSRLTMAAQDMMQLMEKNCINISSLLSRYTERCLEISNDPLKAGGVRAPDNSNAGD
jgi:hypothetical protein